MVLLVDSGSSRKTRSYCSCSAWRTEKPSASLCTAISLRIIASSHWSGSCRCNMMPWIYGSSFSLRSAS